MATGFAHPYGGTGGFSPVPSNGPSPSHGAVFSPANRQGMYKDQRYNMNQENNYAQSPVNGAGRFNSMQSRYATENQSFAYSSPSHRGQYKRDNRREWDLTQLRSKLTEMDGAIADADANLQYARGEISYPYGAEEEMQDPSMMQQMWGIPQEPEIDVTELPIREGWILKKGQGLLRRWTERYARLEGVNFNYYVDDLREAPQASVKLSANSTVEAGDTKDFHRNKKVRFTFMIHQDDDYSLVISVEEEETQQRWIQAIQYVINKCMEAQAANQQAFQQGFHSSMHGDGGNEIIDEEEERKMREEQEAIDSDEAQRHTAWGPGLTDAIHGETATFTIQANDETGAPLQQPLDEVEPFKATLCDDDLELDLVVEDNGDGTYIVEYTAPRAGTYDLNVTYHGQHIFGSPFAPDVELAPTAPKHCLVEGEGMQLAYFDRPNVFTIIACDQFDGLRETGGDQFEVTIHGPAIMSDLVDHENGRYSVIYEMRLTENDIELARRGQAPALAIEVNLRTDRYFYARPIAGSPFHPQIQLTSDVIASVMSPSSRMRSGQSLSYTGGDVSSVQSTPTGNGDWLVNVSQNSEFGDKPRVTVNTNRVSSLPEKQNYNSLTSNTPNVTRSATDAGAPNTAASGLGTRSQPNADGVSMTVPNLQTQTPGHSDTNGSSQFMSPIELSSTASVPRIDTSNLSNTERAALEKERAELERAKAEFAKEMENFQKMRQQVEVDRSTVDQQMARVSDLGRRVRDDAQNLMQRARELKLQQQHTKNSNESRQTTPLASNKYSNKYNQSPSQSLNGHQEGNNKPMIGSPAAHSASKHNTDSKHDFHPSEQKESIQQKRSVPMVSPADARHEFSPKSEVNETKHDMHETLTREEIDTQSKQQKPDFSVPGSGAEAPAELFESDVVTVFEMYKRPLAKAWAYFSDNFSGTSSRMKTEPRGMTLHAWICLCKEYVITPTFITRRELRGIFLDAYRAHSETELELPRGNKETDALAAHLKLSFAAFTEALGRLALVALLRPAFMHIYPTTRDKVLVVLDMWGVGRADYLSRIKSQHRALKQRRSEQTKE